MHSPRSTVECATPLLSSPPVDAGAQQQGELLRGIQSHVAVDRRFHGSPLFQQLCLSQARRIRHDYGDRYARLSFMVHVTLELLIDACIARQHVGILDDYYQHLETVPLQPLQQLAEQYCGKPLPQFGDRVQAFVQSRFLHSYDTDNGLFQRLQQVIRRAQLKPATDVFAAHLPSLRELVEAHWRTLVSEAHAE